MSTEINRQDPSQDRSEKTEGAEILALCACACVDITPSDAVALAGYAHRLAPFERVADPLEANILRLGSGAQSVFIIQIDTLFCSTELTEAVYRAIEARLTNAQGDKSDLPPRENLVFVASHTHGAPSLDPTKPLLGAVDHAYFRAVVEKLAQALASMVLGAAGAGTGAGAGVETGAGAAVLCTLAHGAAQDDQNLAIARRRRSVFINRAWPYVHFGTVMQPNPATPIDRTIRLAVLRRADGGLNIAAGAEVAAGVNAGAGAAEVGARAGSRSGSGAVECVVWGWACHPVLHPDTAAVSADFVGHVRRAVRRHVGADVPVIFLPGFAGDIRPRMVTRRPPLRARLALPFGAVFRPATTAEYEQWCSALGAQLCNLYDRVAARMSGAAQGNAATAHVRRNDVNVPEIIDGDNEGRICPVAVLTLQTPDGRGICWPLVGAEVLASYGEKICAAAVAAHHHKKAAVWPVAYYDAVFGYLPDDAQIAQGGYEAQRFFGSFGLKGAFKQHVQARIIAAFQRLLDGDNGAA